MPPKMEKTTRALASRTELQTPPMECWLMHVGTVCNQSKSAERNLAR